jgi:hypothetical protein
VSAPRRVDDATAMRDLFVATLGGAGVLVGAAFALRVGGRPPDQALTLAAWATPTSGAVTALLAADLVRCLGRAPRWSAVLLRLGLLGLNAILLAAEVLVLAVSALATRAPGP